MEILHKKLIAYVIVFIIIGLILSRKTDNRILSFIFLFWILASPILYMPVFQIKILPFALHPHRLLLILLCLYLFLSKPVKQANYHLNKIEGSPGFEKWLYIYFVMVVISLVLNYPKIQIKQQLVTVPLEILLFIITYHIAKTRVSSSVFDSIITALMIVAVTTSIIAILQILIDPYFLRGRYGGGALRTAFISFKRSSGIFYAEYELGCLVNLSIILLLVKYRSRQIFYICLPLLLTALVTTFHRLSWVVFAVCFISFLFINRRNILLFIMSILLFLMAADAFSSFLTESKVFQVFKEERLLEDTLSGRFEQYELAVDLISDNFFGLGGYDTDIYYDKMTELNPIEDNRYLRNKGRPTVIHNGYLSIGVQYGLLSMFAYIVMILMMLLYFARRIKISDKMTIVPFYAVFIWLMYNMSNDFSTFRLYFVILVALISGSFVSFYNNSGISEVSGGKTKCLIYQ